MNRRVIRGIVTLTAVVLTARLGRVQFQGHDETYYNLSMKRIVQQAQNKGIPGEYWESENGCKMYGEFIMCAGAPGRYGEIIETSLGQGIILDTGSFAKTNPTCIDIATNW